jgi:hypothetical protein
VPPGCADIILVARRRASAAYGCRPSMGAYYPGTHDHHRRVRKWPRERSAPGNIFPTIKATIQVHPKCTSGTSRDKSQVQRRFWTTLTHYTDWRRIDVASQDVYEDHGSASISFAKSCTEYSLSEIDDELQHVGQRSEGKSCRNLSRDFSTPSLKLSAQLFTSSTS